MQLSDFSGGKSTRLDPSLIQLNEGVVYSNIDNTKAVLTSAKGFLLTNIAVEGNFYKYNGAWISSNLERDYLEYKDKLYYTEENSTAKKFDGVRTTNMGIAAPTIKLTSTQVDPISTEKVSSDDTVVQYCYTYYNVQDDVESAPSPISDELSLMANKVVNLSGFLPPSDSQVDKIRLYRIGADATTMTLLIELPITTITYIDSIPTLSAIGTLLDSYDNLPTPLGARYLVEAYGIGFAAVGDKLYYSVQARLNYWPALNYIDLNGDITGILPIQDGILVFTIKSMSLVIGNTISNFSLVPISTEQGCNSHKSCKLVKNMPTWSSNDGICQWQNGRPEVVSKDRLGKLTLNIKNTAVYDEQYYICLINGNLMSMDLRFGRLSFKDYDLDDDIVNIGVFDNALYAMVKGKVATMFNGKDLKLSYTSPELSEGASSMVKLYNVIYIRAKGIFTIIILVDDQEVIQKDLQGDQVHEIKVPEERQRGSRIQFNIGGIGTVKEIEYKTVGRQNGR